MGDEENRGSPTRHMKRGPSSGRMLLGDRGWMGPFNRMVWTHPNSLLYILVFLGGIAFWVLKSQHYRTNAVSSEFRGEAANTLCRERALLSRRRAPPSPPPRPPVLGYTRRLPYPLPTHTLPCCSCCSGCCCAGDLRCPHLHRPAPTLFLYCSTSPAALPRRPTPRGMTMTFFSFLFFFHH